MIDYENTRWYEILARIDGSVIPRLTVRVLIAAAIGALSAWTFAAFELKLSPIAHTMIGAALGLLLVFRTNASYDRYWEGRKLFGAMVNRCRDLVRQASAFLGRDDAAEVGRWSRAWYATVVQTLRSESDLAVLGDLLRDEERTALERVTHRAPVIASWIGAKLESQTRAGRLSERRLMLMDANLTSLMDSLGGCERIRKTPIPFAYAQHIKIFTVFFCFTAPFAMVESMGWYTPIAAGLLAFALFGIDEIGVEIEDPFGRDPNDLPLEAIEKTIAKSIDDILETPAPEKEDSAPAISAAARPVLAHRSADS